MIPNFQPGFRKRYSTIHHIHRVNTINSGLHSGQYFSANFLIKVWHVRLLYKIRKHLQGDIFFLLKSYLKNREFYVFLNSVESETKTINAGVFQGNVFDSTLFFIYTTDFPEYYYTNMTALLASLLNTKTPTPLTGYCKNRQIRLKVV